ncbi:MAG: Ig-like domain-containing protein, partial [Deltaproteobacteria bacterium]|nr:Ig-like domain-containing protein [Deltaproteobacteria bacterium]
MNSRWLTYSFALLGLMLLYACKGGGDGDVGGTFLEVLQTSPENGTTDTQVATRVGFQIDAPIDPTTLTNETFVVTDPDGTQVVGALAIGDEPNIAVLTPDESLAVITRFTATITTGLRSTSGV